MLFFVFFVSATQIQVFVPQCGNRTLLTQNTLPPSQNPSRLLCGENVKNKM